MSPLLRRHDAALMDYSSKGSFSFIINRERNTSQNHKLQMTPEFGFSYSEGSIDLRRLGNPFGGTTKFKEERYKFKFKYYYFFTSYSAYIKPLKNQGIRFFTGPKLMYRLAKNVSGNLKKTIVDYSIQPIVHEFSDQRTINSEKLTFGPQLNWRVGIDQIIKIAGARFIVEFSYELPLFKIYYPVRFQANPIIFGFKYSFKKKKSG